MFKNQRRTLDQKILSGIIFCLHEEFFHWWLILFIISMLIFMCICLLFKARIVMADPEKYRDWFEKNYTRVIGQALCNFFSYYRVSHIDIWNFVVLLHISMLCYAHLWTYKGPILHDTSVYSWFWRKMKKKLFRFHMSGHSM